MLVVSDVHFEYAEERLLHGVSFGVPTSALLHVQGPNGVGKTTLLKLLAGLLRPTDGTIEWCDATRPCFVGHKPGINRVFSPREHWQYDVCCGAASALSFEFAVHALGLQRLEDIPCALLSVGQLRRVSLLRLLVSSATLWLLDEPFVGLDAAGMASLTHLLEQHLGREGQVVLTSHQPLPFVPTICQEYWL